MPLFGALSLLSSLTTRTPSPLQVEVFGEKDCSSVGAGVERRGEGVLAPPWDGGRRVRRVSSVGPTPPQGGAVLMRPANAACSRLPLRGQAGREASTPAPPPPQPSPLLNDATYPIKVVGSNLTERNIPNGQGFESRVSSRLRCLYYRARLRASVRKSNIRKTWINVED